jgi:hypothetical protein
MAIDDVSSAGYAGSGQLPIQNIARSFNPFLIFHSSIDVSHLSPEDHQVSQIDPTSHIHGTYSISSGPSRIPQYNTYYTPFLQQQACTGDLLDPKADNLALRFGPNMKAVSFIKLELTAPVEYKDARPGDKAVAMLNLKIKVKVTGKRTIQKPGVPDFVQEGTFDETVSLNFTQEASVTGSGVKDFKFDLSMSDIGAKAAEVLNKKAIVSATEDGKPVARTTYADLEANDIVPSKANPRLTLWGGCNRYGSGRQFDVKWKINVPTEGRSAMSADGTLEPVQQGK